MGLTYLLIDLAMLLGPLTGLAALRTGFSWRAFALSILSAGLLFIAWDVIATTRGDWSFNPAHVMGPALLGLPLEELLFFIAAPLGCIFFYEAACRKEETNSKNKNHSNIALAISALLAISGLLLPSTPYTSWALLAASFTIGFVTLSKSGLLSSPAYWKYLSFCFLAFLAVNYLLTSIPVVEYSPAAITGYRFLTIPLEDFLFNFSMITLYLWAYLRWNEKKVKSGKLK